MTAYLQLVSPFIIRVAVAIAAAIRVLFFRRLVFPDNVSILVHLRLAAVTRVRHLVHRICVVIAVCVLHGTSAWHVVGTGSES